METNYTIYKDILSDELSWMRSVLKGYETYIVGGAVRALYMLHAGLLQKWDTDDIDFVTSATPEQIKEAVRLYNGFECINPILIKKVGEAFGVVILTFLNDSYEVATMRVDSNQNGRHTDVTYTTDVREDVKRRDFTMNALLFDKHDNIIDYTTGKVDIDNKILNTVQPAEITFKQDYLRILRAARFAARYAFIPHLTVINAIIILKGNILTHISPERVVMEFDKAFYAPNPSKFINLLGSIGILQILFPEYENAASLLQNPKWHPEGDVLTHICNVVERADPSIRWEALLHDIGKPIAAQKHKDWDSTKPETQFYTYYRHDLKGIPLAEDICKRYKFSNELSTSIFVAVKYHLLMYTLVNESKKRKMGFELFKIAKTPERFEKLVTMLKLLGTADIEQMDYPKNYMVDVPNPFKINLPTGAEIIEALNIPERNYKFISVVTAEMYKYWIRTSGDISKEAFMDVAHKLYLRLSYPIILTPYELTILRGIPGSGKSTHAKAILKTDPKAIIASADNYFINKTTGQYEFDVTKLRRAHEACRELVRESMSSGVKNIVVDNTNTTEVEFEDYITYAKQYNYRIKIITFWHNKNKPEIYRNRNVHGVPLEAIQKMMNRFEMPAEFPGPSIITIKD